MITVDARNATMAMAHVFAEADVSDREQLRTFRLDRSQRLLNDPVFRVSAAGLLIFMLRNSEKQDSLQPEVLNATRFIGNVFHGQLKDSRHAADGSALIQFFADEQRQNKIENGQMRFSDEISQRR